MKRLRFATAAWVVLSVRLAAGQDQTLFPAPPAAEEVASQAAPLAAQEQSESDRMLSGSGIPYTPYPAGLSYLLAPQPFRVPYPNRIYYPPAHYVRLCPYYSRGVYWGADWNKRLLGCNPWLIHGDKRFNPYLTQAKIQHHTGQARHSAPPHFGPMPGGHVHYAPPLAEAKSSRRDSKSVEIASAPSKRSQSVSKPASKTERSTTTRTSQVRFAATASDDETPEAPSASEAPEAPEAKSTAKTAVKTANRGAERTLPAWQRPPAVRR